jgi:hypothetical protein
MIGNALRTDIEGWAARIDDNPAFQMVRAGRFGGQLLARYVSNLTYMLRLTPKHLRQGQERARARGDEALVRHFEHKFEQEDGHHLWGEADLTALHVEEEAPLPSILTLAEYLTRAIDDDPTSYLVYMAFAEYITVLVGPAFLSLIEEKNGVPRSSLTVIDIHVERDRDHAEEGWGAIDDLVPDPRRLAFMRQTLGEIIERFDAFCVELALSGAKDDESSPRLVGGVVSAA